MSHIGEGDVVILKSGGRFWTVDYTTTGVFAWSPRKVRIVAMSDGGLLQETEVLESSLQKVNPTDEQPGTRVRPFGRGRLGWGSGMS